MYGPAFTFICGDDDFLVAQEGRALFAEKTRELADDFSKETVEAAAQNMSEVEEVVNRFRDSVQTLSMFGDKKVVWLKDVNFLADSVTGRAEGTKKLVEDLQAVLETLDPAAVEVIVTAFPVDRRRKEFKWFQKAADFRDLKGANDEDSLIGLARAEAEQLQAQMGMRAAAALVAKVQGNTRLILEETRKLATYVGSGGEIVEGLVAELVPAFGEGDFFEAAEAFFSLNLRWTLDALRRHFFTNSEARPLIASMQNRNRLMIQLRVMMDGGELRLSPRGFAKPEFDRAARTYAKHFGGFDDKSSFNVFTQNLWYLGNKIAPSARELTLKRLIDFQLEFMHAFEDLIRRPTDQEAVMRDLAIRCLS
ncbi:DNA polymerase III subunit delta [Ruficoccus amylovorans]|uniref:DNA polymerase III subunit delta n=1 Tax=Ruficoccus amylovorans TaxID=1804625 RepID=A0A842HG89_9BACT|nr:DNA polymerase III subunit delta [Ruficoccus amylovorans]MBC2595543.1 DNA polymerase III subunit delta [Ruficoccus amylovorans]